VRVELPPILLTSSIVAMDQTVLLADQSLRIFHTLESLRRWLVISPDSHYVVCDGSDYDFSGLVREHFPGAKIECLHFRNEEVLVRFHGKGFGEGEIIKYALENSEYLKTSQWFVKCTAKLWVENYFECLREWNGTFLCKAFFSNVFSLSPVKLEYIDTRFYLVNKKFYQDNFIEAHIGIGGKKGVSIEDRFLAILLSGKFKHFLFRIPPTVCGVGGGSGRYYKNSIIRRAKERVRSLIPSSMTRYREFF
jgi:hypothetical protein